MSETERRERVGTGDVIDTAHGLVRIIGGAGTSLDGKHVVGRRVSGDTSTVLHFARPEDGWLVVVQ